MRWRCAGGYYLLPHMPPLPLQLPLPLLLPLLLPLPLPRSPPNPRKKQKMSFDRKAFAPAPHREVAEQ